MSNHVFAAAPGYYVLHLVPDSTKVVREPIVGWMDVGQIGSVQPITMQLAHRPREWKDLYVLCPDGQVVCLLNGDTWRSESIWLELFRQARRKAMQETEKEAPAP